MDENILVRSTYEKFATTLKRFFQTTLFFLHLVTVVHQFYQIIGVVDNDDGYEILMRKIQYGSTATVSLISFIFYVWYSSFIRSTYQKLEKIDHEFESIDAKGCNKRDRSMTTFVLICVYVVSFVFHFYTRYLRGCYFYGSVNFFVIFVDCFVRTYHVIVNAFVAYKFTKSIFDGGTRFKRLNYLLNYKVDASQSPLQVKETNDVNRIYFQIIDYCDCVKRYYQVPIFLILTTDMFTTMYMILTAFHEFVSRSVPTWAVLFCIVDPFIRIMQTVSVISTADTTAFQTHKWADTLQRVMIESEIDARVKEKLKLFLMEIVDKRLVFYIGGFFKLSHETLVAMMGTVSTYLLIMMQFQPLGVEEDESKRTAKSKLF